MSNSIEVVEVGKLETRGQSLSLVVILHGTGGSPEKMDKIRNSVANFEKDADIWRPNLPLTLLSTIPYDEIVLELIEELDRIIKAQGNRGKAYKEIKLVGFSAGSLLVRKLYIVIRGNQPNTPLGSIFGDPPVKDWAPLVTRIILLSGMNRGWKIDYHMGRLNATIWTAGIIFGKILQVFTRKEPNILSIQRGGKFITELRLQWLEMCRVSKQTASTFIEPVTVQLLGTIDDIASPEDNIDLVSGSDFVYLDVPFTGHQDILEMDDSENGRVRRTIFKQALIDSRSSLHNQSEIPADEGIDQINNEIKKVAFIVHGIRDVGHWTQKIGRHIKRKGAEMGVTFATESSSYGFFPMIQFFLPWKRNQKVAWFMDRYAEARARFPNAQFSFVGHSHGTYLLAKSLQDYPCCRFENVAFAGSVVRKGFDWDLLIKKQQVHKVANYVATTDWVVAFFPNIFELIPLQDLGSAGHDGFAQCKSPNVRNLSYLHGTHSAAIKEENWDALAHFIVTGEMEFIKIHPHGEPQKRPTLDRRKGLWTKIVSAIAHLPQVAVVVIIALLLILGYAILTGLTFVQAPEWAITLTLLAYLSLVWWILNKC